MTSRQAAPTTRSHNAGRPLRSFAGNTTTLDDRLQVGLEAVHIGASMSGPLQNISAFRGDEYVVVVTGKNVGTNSIRSSDMAWIRLPIQAATGTTTTSTHQ
ncbi:hypothetical protein PQQ64_29195 [Paraburkholderia graminis]|uniref:hypothetical protein n=1 Tax=Paraburkholderia graminis TaxID=60548 RepID=UPI0038BB22A6